MAPPDPWSSDEASGDAPRGSMPERSDVALGIDQASEASGPVSALFGVAIFLGFLLFAVQVTAHLWTTSAVTAAAFDGARLVAGERPIPRTDAEDHVEQVLGDYGARVTFDWSASTTDEVVLRVSGPTPAALIESVGRLAGLDRIDRTVRVRREVLS